MGDSSDVEAWRVPHLIESLTVAELIAQLSTLPPDARVSAVYDGACRTPIQVVWLTQAGHVALASHGDDVYYDEDRPMGAPSAEAAPFWSTPEG